MLARKLIEPIILSVAARLRRRLRRRTGPAPWPRHQPERRRRPRLSRRQSVRETNDGLTATSSYYSSLLMTCGVGQPAGRTQFRNCHMQF